MDQIYFNIPTRNITTAQAMCKPRKKRYINEIPNKDIYSLIQSPKSKVEIEKKLMTFSSEARHPSVFIQKNGRMKQFQVAMSDSESNQYQFIQSQQNSNTNQYFSRRQGQQETGAFQLNVQSGNYLNGQREIQSAEQSTIDSRIKVLKKNQDSKMESKMGTSTIQDIKNNFINIVNSNTQIQDESVGGTKKIIELKLKNKLDIQQFQSSSTNNTQIIKVGSPQSNNDSIYEPLMSITGKTSAFDQHKTLMLQPSNQMNCTPTKMQQADNIENIFFLIPDKQMEYFSNTESAKDDGALAGETESNDAHGVDIQHLSSPRLKNRPVQQENSESKPKMNNKGMGVSFDSKQNGSKFQNLDLNQLHTSKFMLSNKNQNGMDVLNQLQTLNANISRPNSCRNQNLQRLKQQSCRYKKEANKIVMIQTEGQRYMSTIQNQRSQRSSKNITGMFKNRKMSTADSQMASTIQSYGNVKVVDNANRAQSSGLKSRTIRSRPSTKTSGEKSSLSQAKQQSLSGLKQMYPNLYNSMSNQQQNEEAIKLLTMIQVPQMGEISRALNINNQDQRYNLEIPLNMLIANQYQATQAQGPLRAETASNQKSQLQMIKMGTDPSQKQSVKFNEDSQQQVSSLAINSRALKKSTDQLSDVEESGSKHNSDQEKRIMLKTKYYYKSSLINITDQENTIELEKILSSPPSNKGKISTESKERIPVLSTKLLNNMNSSGVNSQFKTMDIVQNNKPLLQYKQDNISEDKQLDTVNTNQLTKSQEKNLISHINSLQNIIQNNTEIPLNQDLNEANQNDHRITVSVKGPPIKMESPPQVGNEMGQQTSYKTIEGMIMPNEEELKIGLQNSNVNEDGGNTLGEEALMFEPQIPKLFIHRQDKNQDQNRYDGAKWRVDPLNPNQKILIQSDADMQMVKSAKGLTKAISGFKNRHKSVQIQAQQESGLKGMPKQSFQIFQMSGVASPLSDKNSSQNLNQAQTNNLYTFNQNINDQTYTNQNFKQVGGQIYKIDKNNEMAKLRLVEYIINRSRQKTSKQKPSSSHFRYSSKAAPDIVTLKQDIGKQLNEPFNDATKLLRRCSISPLSEHQSKSANLNKIFTCQSIKSQFDSRKPPPAVRKTTERKVISIQQFNDNIQDSHTYDGKLIKELQDLMEKQSNFDSQRSNLAPVNRFTTTPSLMVLSQAQGAKSDQKSQYQNINLTLGPHTLHLSRHDTLMAESPKHKHRPLRRHQETSLQTNFIDYDNMNSTENITVICNKKDGTRGRAYVDQPLPPSELTSAKTKSIMSPKEISTQSPESTRQVYVKASLHKKQINLHNQAQKRITLSDNLDQSFTMEHKQLNMFQNEMIEKRNPTVELQQNLGSLKSVLNNGSQQYSKESKKSISKGAVSDASNSRNTPKSREQSQLTGTSHGRQSQGRHSRNQNSRLRSKDNNSMTDKAKLLSIPAHYDNDQLSGGPNRSVVNRSPSSQLKHSSMTHNMNLKGQNVSINAQDLTDLDLDQAKEIKQFFKYESVAAIQTEKGSSIAANEIINAYHDINNVHLPQAIIPMMQRPMIQQIKRQNTEDEDANESKAQKEKKAKLKLLDTTPQSYVSLMQMCNKAQTRHQSPQQTSEEIIENIDMLFKTRRLSKYEKINYKTMHDQQCQKLIKKSNKLNSASNTQRNDQQTSGSPAKQMANYKVLGQTQMNWKKVKKQESLDQKVRKLLKQQGEDMHFKKHLIPRI